MGEFGANARDTAVILVSLGAAVFDVRFRRIPSWLTLPGIAAGFGYWAITSTPRQFAGVVAVTALTFVVGFLLYAVSILGGGDGKLLTCVAALEGPGLFAECVAWMLVAGVVISIAILGWRRALVPLARRIGVSLVDLLRFGIVSNPIEGSEPHRMPFAVVVLIAVVLTVAGQRAGFRLLP